jgi:hypothetical protein
MGRLHPRAAAYVYERPNNDGLIPVAEGPYPYIVSRLAS